MTTAGNLIQKGVEVADSKIYERDKIWSRYSNDKVEIGEGLALMTRFLSKTLPLGEPMRALSIGSSSEPQFRILESAYRGGLYLLDVEKDALAVVKERIKRQHTTNVNPYLGNYTKIFQTQEKAAHFLEHKLHDEKVHLITLHHSLYYSRPESWTELFQNLYQIILAPKGLMHAVLMIPESCNEASTTWLYNHYAGKYFGHRNDQDLLKFERDLAGDPVFKNAVFFSRTHHIRFFVDDFEKFMSVIWMILLYPDVHPYTQKQKEEITEFVFRKFWLHKRPLIQLQNHVSICRGICLEGLEVTGIS